MPIFIGLYIGDERLYYMGMRFQSYGYGTIELENQHLTLLFIGDYRGVFLWNIVRLLEDVELSLPSVLVPVELALLPPEKYTNVVVVVRKDKSLVEARKIIEEKLKENNVVIRDRYSFMPHITIARRKRPPDPSRLRKLISLSKKLQHHLPKFIVVRDVFLYETTREGYRKVLRLRTRWV